MSNKVTTTKKVTSSYQISKDSKKYNKYLNSKNDTNKSTPQIRTSQKDNKRSRPTSIKSESNIIERQAKNNYDSSSKRRSQEKCTCGQWETDTYKVHYATKSMNNSNYFNGEDGKDMSNRYTGYKKNTNKTINSNDKNIFIQECNNSEYGSSAGAKEKQYFSITKSENSLDALNEYTDEDINLCTCGQNTTIQTKSSEKNDYKSKVGTNKLRYSSNLENISNEFPIKTTDYEEKETNISSEIIINKKLIKEKIWEEIKRKEEKEGIEWSGENYIQVIERLQYLVEPPPQLRVQFINDMMINRTLVHDPIKILIPIPDNFMQKQAVLEVLAEKKEEKKEEKVEEICPENVDILNIEKECSKVHTFDDLKIEKEELYVEGIEEKEQIEPFVIENYSWHIDPSERMWSGDMKLIRINKLNIEKTPKQFNNIDIKSNEKIAFKGVKRVLKKKVKELKQSENTAFKIGGDGFDINKYKIPLESTHTDKMEMIPERKDWNKVNGVSSESKVNLLPKEIVKKNWNEQLNQQIGEKLDFTPKTKKWTLSICKEIDIIYKQESEEVLVNDDYNNVKELGMRPITATIFKIMEEDDTSSVASFDVFQNIIFNKKIYEETKVMAKKRAMVENEQKVLYDTSMTAFVAQTNNVGK
jgi:hypothetical protein